MGFIASLYGRIECDQCHMFLADCNGKQCVGEHHNLDDCPYRKLGWQPQGTRMYCKQCMREKMDALQTEVVRKLTQSFDGTNATVQASSHDGIVEATVMLHDEHDKRLTLIVTQSLRVTRIAAVDASQWGCGVSVWAPLDTVAPTLPAIANAYLHWDIFGFEKQAYAARITESFDND